MCYESQVLNTHLLSKNKLLPVMLWCIVYLYSLALNKAWTQVLRISDVNKILIMTESIYQATGEWNIGNVAGSVGNSMREKCISKTNSVELSR